MKILASMLLISFIGTVASAQEITKTVSDKNVVINVNVKPGFVKLTSLGYGQPTVKIIIPELAGETLLNHRNDGEAGPCLATVDTTDPNEIINGQPAIEPADLNIKVEQTLSADEANKICHLTLVETINTVIRGKKFNHVRSIALPDRVLADCF